MNLGKHVATGYALDNAEPAPATTSLDPAPERPAPPAGSIRAPQPAPTQYSMVAIVGGEPVQVAAGRGREP
ncbi:hypothetical protein Psed_5668 [Pseudonocardia dioxanivorans CB1190]|jgi:hypothetical protein|uniref:Uncharacterized protein n=1 Tax=Pseudonocardia dioxanivorans (strain ATCC 55486 / DSM 44775 / JCM 13855 / CB1190) TaxID=675635 RepID=F4CZX0_PSEUX|nr:hypothetical protein [Pseudonocardia dioxanivorans]AEA27796.1 hypothetical protein Psed_5668 [Pseudonocardia dioxanivorans CB1190]